MVTPDHSPTVSCPKNSAQWDSRSVGRHKTCPDHLDLLRSNACYKEWTLVSSNLTLTCEFTTNVSYHILSTLQRQRCSNTEAGYLSRTWEWPHRFGVYHGRNRIGQHKFRISFSAAHSLSAYSRTIRADKRILYDFENHNLCTNMFWFCLLPRKTNQKISVRVTMNKQH